LLAEFTLPIDRDAPDRTVALIMSTATALDLPGARLKQVRQLIVEAISNRAGGNTCTIRLFVAQPIEDQPYAPPCCAAGSDTQSVCVHTSRRHLRPKRV
jgi:hypothetical protein